MTDIACKSIYWAGLNAQILDKYKGCEICQEMSRRDYPAEPIQINVKTSLLPMESLNIDWGEYGKHKLMVVVNRATLFLEAMSTYNVMKFLSLPPLEVPRR